MCRIASVNQYYILLQSIIILLLTGVRVCVGHSPDHKLYHMSTLCKLVMHLQALPAFGDSSYDTYLAWVVYFVDGVEEISSDSLSRRVQYDSGYGCSHGFTLAHC